MNEGVRVCMNGANVARLFSPAASQSW